MNITYRVKNVWGNDLMYPVSLDAKFICQISGKKTLTDDSIRLAKQFYPDTTSELVL